MSIRSENIGFGKEVVQVIVEYKLSFKSYTYHNFTFLYYYFILIWVLHHFVIARYTRYFPEFFYSSINDFINKKNLKTHPLTIKLPFLLISNSLSIGPSHINKKPISASYFYPIIK